jgi:hypothetical protein
MCSSLLVQLEQAINKPLLWKWAYLNWAQQTRIDALPLDATCQHLHRVRPGKLRDASRPAESRQT